MGIPWGQCGRRCHLLSEETSLAHLMRRLEEWLYAVIPCVFAVVGSGCDYR